MSAAPVININNQPPKEEEGTDEVQQRVYYIDSKTNVLLQTAEAVISDVVDKKQMKARILSDPGSKRSYISECVKTCLQLETDHHKMVNVKTLAGERMNVLDATKVCIKSLDQNLTVYVNGFCFDKICDLLINQPIQIAKENFEHLKDLELAHSGDRGLEVDILLGADFHWEIMSGNMRWGENYGPVALGSKLGWILSGPVQVNETEINTSVNSIQAKAINTHFMKLNETLKAF